MKTQANVILSEGGARAEEPAPSEAEGTPANSIPRCRPEGILTMDDLLGLRRRQRVDLFVRMTIVSESV
jgi:hypothetical protein